MGTTDPNKIDSDLRPYLYDPTVLDILRLIKKDKEALGAGFTINAIKTANDKHIETATRYTTIVLRLMDDKLIEQDSYKGFKLTKEGELYLKIRDPRLVYKGTKYSRLAMIASFASILLTIGLWLSPRQQQGNNRPPPVTDILNNQPEPKVYQNNKKADSIPKPDTQTPASPPHTTRGNK